MELMEKITVIFKKNELHLFNEYAKSQGMPLSILLKEALKEKIENELDMKIIQQYEDDLDNNLLKFYDHYEVKEILKL